ncbi:TIGR00304 family membrane protein [Picrophilus oshimae]|uniref:TIGR00304 family protein n=1 Tax=Picrophilus torridus (strain ATCC 700027 / DSM 9790 / JCM 10055 / NBRC 100828 / KAW 2/3) TaxID=1122961 RepID=A0A8G2FVS4_PICTO|nr:DUF131 domain-containing protein [Picrophilus oshimae]SMD30407.1 TIGR00304 family protein [Picrophilus oshimae DSM 9789]
MNYIKAGLALIFSGFLLFIILAIFGLVKLGLFLVFPFAISTSVLSIIPFLLIFIGFIMIFFYPFVNDYRYNDYKYYEYQDEYDHEDSKNEYNKDDYKESSKKYSGFLLIGPVPIIFGNDRRLVYISIIIAVLIIIFYFILILAHLL